MAGPVVRGGSVDYLLRKSFPDFFSFENVYRNGTGSAHTRNVTGVDL